MYTQPSLWLTHSITLVKVVEDVRTWNLLLTKSARTQTHKELQGTKTWTVNGINSFLKIDDRVEILC
jgi:hypothetical protein